MPSCHGLVSILDVSDAVGLIMMKIEAAREKENRKKIERADNHRWRRQEERKERKQEKKEEIKREEAINKDREENIEKTEPRCSECGWTACSETIRQYWDAVAFTKEKLKAMDQDNLSILLYPMMIWQYYCNMFIYVIHVPVDINLEGASISTLSKENLVCKVIPQ